MGKSRKVHNKTQYFPILFQYFSKVLNHIGWESIGLLDLYGKGKVYNWQPDNVITLPSGKLT